MNKYSVILFFSNNYALWTRKVLKKTGFDHRMIPVPRHLSSDCGYCVRVLNEDVQEIERLLDKNKIEYDCIAIL